MFYYSFKFSSLSLVLYESEILFSSVKCCWSLLFLLAYYCNIFNLVSLDKKSSSFVLFYLKLFKSSFALISKSNFVSLNDKFSLLLYFVLFILSFYYVFSFINWSILFLFYPFLIIVDNDTFSFYEKFNFNPLFGLI